MKRVKQQAGGGFEGARPRARLGGRVALIAGLLAAVALSGCQALHGGAPGGAADESGAAASAPGGAAASARASLPKPKSAGAARMQAAGPASVGLKRFEPPAAFDAACRGGEALTVPGGLSHTDYLRKAFERELVAAGVYARERPRVTLSAHVNRLAFSSTRLLNNGHWDIGLTLESSNGKALDVAEHFEFKTSFSGDEACERTAEAYQRAVASLITKVVAGPDFAPLLRP